MGNIHPHADADKQRDQHTGSDLLLDNIPHELKPLPQWVLYKLGPVKPDGHRDKIPFNPRTGARAKVNDPETWGSLEEVVEAYLRGNFDGPGFVFTASDPFVGIDLDGCRDPHTGHIAPWALDIMQRVNSYTEASPSGTGLHILPKGKLPGGGRKEGQVEMYETSRFFTMTGEHIAGTPTTCEERSEAITDLYRTHFPHKIIGNGFDTGKHTHANMSDAERRETLAELRDALPFIPAIEHDVWLQVGMGLHFLDSGKASFDLWVAWSQTCPEKFNHNDCLKRWRSFHNDGGITHKTLFALAITHGWQAKGQGHAHVDDTADTRDEEPPDPHWAGEETEATSRGTQQKNRVTFNLTETGNAERLAQQHGQILRWCELWKKWLVYNKTHWQVDISHRARQLAKATVRKMYTEAAAADDDERRQKLVKHALQSESEKARRAMLELAKGEGKIPALPEQFDADPWLLNVANGTLDLRTGTLRPHSPADYITKYIPIIYDPDATCPVWEAFLASLMAGNDDVVDFLWKAIGYSLTGDVREDCLFLLYGSGANGKSTFLTILRAILADYGKQAAFSTFLHQERETVRNDLADLHGARLVVASETDEGKRFSLSVVKQLTGQDKVKARFLFAEYFEFSPHLKLWLAANHKPVIRGTDHAIWRRIRLVPFTQKYEGATKDDTMRDKLLAELPGILAWAIRGCLAWQEEKLPLPETVKSATEGYRNEMDVVGAFIEECCEVEERANVLTASLFDSYVAWCKRSGEEASSKKTFGIRMEERGFTPGKGSGGIRIWKGLKLAVAE